jgi:hypothetical protein
MNNLFTLAIDFDLPIQQLCIDTLLKYNPECKVYRSYDEIRAIPGGKEFISIYSKLSPVHFSDVFRIWYLLKFGGTWIDADCIHMRPFEFTYELNKSGVSFVWNDGTNSDITQCVIHCPKPNNQFLQLLLQRIEKLCTDKTPAELAYLDLGQWSIDHIRATSGIEPTVSPHWEYLYIPWYNKSQFIEQAPWYDFQFDRNKYSPNSYCYHLTNAVIEFAKHDSKEHLLSLNTFLSFLLRRALTNGWEDNRHSAILKRMPEFLKAYNYAEVGVYKGHTLSVIGQQRNNATLFAIDPWKNVSTDDYKNTGDYIAFESDEKQQENYNECMANCWFLTSQQRLKVNRKQSELAYGDYHDNFFDMVFIDGDHSYQAVKNDIDLWYPKVKDGGYIGGHDYDYPGLDFGVKQAVDEFVTKHNLTLELDSDWTWFIKK